jgi:hypothetical protein
VGFSLQTAVREKLAVFAILSGGHEGAPLGTCKAAESVARRGRAKARWNMLRYTVVKVRLVVSCKSRRLNSDGVSSVSQADFICRQMPPRFPEVPGYWGLARYMEAISLQFSIIANSGCAEKCKRSTL